MIEAQMRDSKKAVTNTQGAETPAHPGQFVRTSALAPKGLSVTAAAKLVGVGRPAFSNFLNGHVAATPEMATRIEIAFGIPAKQVLDLQSAYEAAQAKIQSTPTNALPYVAPFLSIKAHEIETWVDRNVAARTRLSVLLRTLANSTGNGITRINFPGNDDAECPDWDGYIESSQPTPWIPEGLSGWEFGTNKVVKTKADGDFAKSINAKSKSDRDKTTFVFVTPRHWPGKAKWLIENKSKEQWKDVRVYDSSDLEQWLEQSIAGQAWFANETLRSSQDVRTLDKCWEEWANVSTPPLPGSLFTPAISGSSTRTLLSRLTSPPAGPTIIAADSIEEALAYLSQVFGAAGGEELSNFRDRVLIFDTPGVIPRLAQGAKDFIAVATNREVEREFGPISRQLQTIAIYPRNATNAEAHITLEPLNGETFRTSLEALGYTRDDISKYSNESGRSLTVLRRRLSNVPAVRAPAWVEIASTARSLIPFMFIGAWNSANTADQIVVTLQANAATYEDVEKDCQRLVALNDAPVWSVGAFRGAVSKIDLLFAISSFITTQDIQRYLDIAGMVLGEDDPKLDLPENEQWAASFRGKSREFSSTLREGISETLVLLAVHGRHLFQSKPGFDCESAIRKLVRTLLTPLKTRVLEANASDLAAYAEAAPEEFLRILEEDLLSERPESYGLMRPVDTGLFGGGSYRSGLLWALEGLAWNPETLPRTTLVLGQLSGIEIHDNLVNKPIYSLKAIFRAWMPQTAANHEQRLDAIKLLANKFPLVAWEICTDQIAGHQTGDYSHKPRWRTDAHGFGDPITARGPVVAFVTTIIELLLNWQGGHSRDMLCDLIDHLHNLSEEHQAKVWDLVKGWAAGSTSDTDKAIVREKIRVTVMSRRGLSRSKQSGQTKLAATAHSAYVALEPADLLCKLEWLFRRHWIEESADELDENDQDFQKRERRIQKMRVDALSEVLNARGLSGIIELAKMGEASFLIGNLLTRELLQNDAVVDFLLVARPSSANDESWTAKNLTSGILHALADHAQRENLLNKVKQKVSQEDFAHLLVQAPFRRSTWLMIDELDDAQRATYWNDVNPDWIRESDEETREAINRLLEYQRPRAAFSCVKYKFNAAGPELLFRLLTEMAKEGMDKPGQYPLEQYYVGQALESIHGSPLLTLEQKAGLEFTYIDALSPLRGRRGKSLIPSLEKYVEAHPEFFAQAIVWTYKRKDGGEDPPEWRVPTDRITDFAERGYKLVEALNRIPGHDEFDVLKFDRLGAWVKIVRDTCTKLGRLDIGDQCIGKLLACAPLGEDGAWPCTPVRQVLEDVHSKQMMLGAHTGLYNSRGVVWRGEGGGQERDLAEQYRGWANALHYSQPFVASQLLMDMVRTYEGEARQEDTQAAIDKRLR